MRLREYRQWCLVVAVWQVQRVWVQARLLDQPRLILIRLDQPRRATNPITPGIQYYAKCIDIPHQNGDVYHVLQRGVVAIDVCTVVEQFQHLTTRCTRLVMNTHHQSSVATIVCRIHPCTAFEKCLEYEDGYGFVVSSHLKCRSTDRVLDNSVDRDVERLLERTDVYTQHPKITRVPDVRAVYEHIVHNAGILAKTHNRFECRQHFLEEFHHFVHPHDTNCV